MLRIGLLTTTLLLFSSWPAAAQQLATPPASKIALSGERVRIGFSYALNTDCSTPGQVKSRLLEQPKNGVAEMITEKGSPFMVRMIKGISAMKSNPILRRTIISHGRTSREKIEL